MIKKSVSRKSRSVTRKAGNDRPPKRRMKSKGKPDLRLKDYLLESHPELGC